jgi:menaquinone-dependent protoporphyrinogen oxidase
VKVLVAYASRYGATEEIADRIAATLLRDGFEVTTKQVQDARGLASYHAFVIGSAAYYFHWLRRATAFVRRNHKILAERPVWLFSSGPLGEDAKDDQGRDKREATVPQEIAQLYAIIHPRGHRVFFGALDPSRLGLTHRFIFKMIAKRDGALLPEGDFRDWNDIERWAHSIAADLKSPTDRHIRDSVVAA